MNINIKNKDNLITMDLRLKEIRYLKNYFIKKETEITIFLSLSNNDVEGYENLFNVDKKEFLKCLFDELSEIDEIPLIKLEDLEIMK